MYNQSMRWYIGDFTDGKLTRTEPVPVEFASDVISLDILDNSDVELAIVFDELKASERNNWNGFLRRGSRFMVLVDEDYPWNSPRAIVWGGFINKVSFPIGGKLQVQLTSVSEYMKARLVIDKWSGSISNPEEETVFQANTWQGVMGAVVYKAFDGSGIPNSQPKPPQILGTLPTTSGSNKKLHIVKTDVKTYFDALNEIKENASGIGIEWRFVPRFKNPTRTSIVWDFVTGTETTPQINSNKTYTIKLEENSYKISNYGSVLDSTDLYSRIWIQSKRGEGDSGADLKGKSVSSSKFPVLFERFYDPGVELTSSQHEEQLAAYVAYGGEDARDITVTVEEQNPHDWKQRLGGVMVFQGVEGTLSQGQGTQVRLTGISFTPGRGTIELTLSKISKSYPRLPTPRNIIGGIADTAHGKNSPTLNRPIGGAGGGGDITPPWTPGDDPGDFNSGTDWGSGGYMPGTSPSDPSALNDVALVESYNTSGVFTQGEGNAVYTAQGKVNDGFYLWWNEHVEGSMSGILAKLSQERRYNDAEYAIYGSYFVGEVLAHDFKQIFSTKLKTIMPDLLNIGFARGDFFEPPNINSSRPSGIRTVVVAIGRQVAAVRGTLNLIARVELSWDYYADTSPKQSLQVGNFWVQIPLNSWDNTQPAKVLTLPAPTTVRAAGNTGGINVGFVRVGSFILSFDQNAPSNNVGVVKVFNFFNPSFPILTNTISIEGSSSRITTLGVGRARSTDEHMSIIAAEHGLGGSILVAQIAFGKSGISLSNWESISRSFTGTWHDVYIIQGRPYIRTRTGRSSDPNNMYRIEDDFSLTELNLSSRYDGPNSYGGVTFNNSFLDSGSSSSPYPVAVFKLTD